MSFEKTQLFYKKQFSGIHTFIIWCSAFLAVVTLAAVPGLRLTGVLRDIVIVVQFIIAWVFVLENIINLVLHFNRRAYLKRNWLVVLVILGFISSQIAGFYPQTVVKVFLFLSLILVFSRLMRNIPAIARRPAATLTGSFLFLIIVGSILLILPGASSEGGQPTGIIDAMFTATSATCVTGLVVRDTYSDFSEFGRTIILLLIQIGGLGLMTFGTFFALALGGGYGIRDRKVMTGLLDTGGIGTVTRLLIFILLFTLAFEAAGFFALNGIWEKGGKALGGGDQVYYSAFHSVSSFCNAGFSFFNNSFISLRDSYGMILVVPLLIICGGLGFAVCLNLFTMVSARIRKLFGGKQTFDGTEIAPPRMTVHTKLVLITTVLLLVGGFVFIYLLESGNPETLKDLDGGRKAAAASFQSVTARTAGFNTIHISKLKDATKFFLIMLMAIGASPGSTGGGIKTVTFAILIITLWSTIRGRPRVEVFKRTIPETIVRRAFFIAVLGVILIAVSALLLSVTESGGGASFLDLLFESTSAFATVGMSTGITPQLTDAGKVIIMLLMLVGRIGPLTVVVAIVQKTGKTELPVENVMVG